MRFRKLVSVLFCIIIAVSGLVTTAYADWYDDVKSGCTWVEIEGDEFVVDTFCGVEARYNESDYYYQCNELIMRFYREAYGLEVMAYMNTGLIMLTEGYGFVEAEAPKKGDIIYVTAAMRDSGSDHWAIVKDYSNGYITMFEQNVLWEGKGAKNRQIKWPSDSYYLLTPVSLGSAPDPVLKGIEEETTVTTTKKPTTTTTTTKATTTTTKPTTTKPTTTATTAKPTTTETTITTTSTTTETTALNTTVPLYDAETTYYSVTQYEEYPILQQTEEITESKEENSDTAFKIPVAAVCGVLTVLIAVLAVILIKKKK